MGGGASKQPETEGDVAEDVAQRAARRRQIQRSQSRKVLEKMDDHLAAHILNDIKDELTPVENASRLLESAMKDQKLPKKVRASLAFSLSVLQLGAAGASAPLGFQNMISLDSSSQIDAEVEHWLLDSFTPDGALGHEKLSPKKKFKALGMGIFAAENLFKAGRHSDEASCTLPIELSDDKEAAIVSKLEGIDSWDWNIFELEALVPDHILEVVVWQILYRRKLPGKFHISQATLRNWLAFLQSSYQSTEYHNATHAADVVQTMHVLLCMGGQDYLTDVQVLSLLLAAAMHDVGHDGLNNMYHKKAMTDRALAFNDISIQENFHASSVLTRMAEDETLNLFNHFNEAQRGEMRRMIIELILNTDMSKHFTMMTDFKSDAAKLGTDPEAWHASVDLLMGCFLHCADISNPAKSTPCAKTWAGRVQSEFFRQGDREKAEGLPISPNCSRDTTSLPASQLGFLKYIVQPSFEAVGKVLTRGGDHIMACVEANLDYWADEAKAQGIELHPSLARAKPEPADSPPAHRDSAKSLTAASPAPGAKPCSPLGAKTSSGRSIFRKSQGDVAEKQQHGEDASEGSTLAARVTKGLVDSLSFNSRNKAAKGTTALQPLPPPSPAATRNT